MNTLLVTNMVIMAIINLVFMVLYERLKPSAEEILQIVVIVTIASLGRVVFAVIPQVQPVTAMVILAGYVYGCRRGYITGMLCAVVSNMFLGQGPWTLFQMTAWGVVGLGGGLLGKVARRGKKERSVIFGQSGGDVAASVAIDRHSLPTSSTLAIIVYSVVAAYIFSFVTDFLSICYISGGLTWASVIAVFGAGFAFQTGHAIFNGIFVALFFKKLVKRLERARGMLTKQNA